MTSLEQYIQRLPQEIQQVIWQFLNPDGLADEGGHNYDDLQQALHQEILQEIQQEIPSAIYCVFLKVCLNMIPRLPLKSLVVIPVHLYRDWCSRLNSLGMSKHHKFKASLNDKRGVKASVRCFSGLLFVERQSGKLIIPNVLSRINFNGGVRLILSTVGRRLEAISSRTDLDQQQKDALQQQVFDQAIEENRTGNHYRNHIVRARNPYGHD